MKAVEGQTNSPIASVMPPTSTAEKTHSQKASLNGAIVTSPLELRCTM